MHQVLRLGSTQYNIWIPVHSLQVSTTMSGLCSRYMYVVYGGTLGIHISIRVVYSPTPTFSADCSPLTVGGRRYMYLGTCILVLVLRHSISASAHLKLVRFRAFVGDNLAYHSHHLCVCFDPHTSHSPSKIGIAEIYRLRTAHQPTRLA